jgi:hypothetical protein
MDNLIILSLAIAIVCIVLYYVIGPPKIPEPLKAIIWLVVAVCIILALLRALAIV